MSMTTNGCGCNCASGTNGGGFGNGFGMVYNDPRFELYKMIVNGWASRSNSIGFESACRMADEAWKAWCSTHGISAD